MKYKRFEETWNNKLALYKERMLEYENDTSDDVVFIDIILKDIRTSIKTPDYFWASVYVDLKVQDPEDDELDIDVVSTQYDFEFIDDTLVLEHARLGENFDVIWDTPDLIESDLIKSLISDMLEMQPKCLISLNKEQIDKMIESNYIDFGLIPAKQLISYYDKFNHIDFLPKDAKDIFLF